MCEQEREWAGSRHNYASKQDANIGLRTDQCSFQNTEYFEYYQTYQIM